MESFEMRKSTLVFAILAASFSGAVMAKDTAKKQMNDAEMDKVTAGYSVNTYPDSNSYNANVNYHAVNNGFQGQNQGGGQSYHAATWQY
jgi:hypothetical protein